MKDNIKRLKCIKEKNIIIMTTKYMTENIVIEKGKIKFRGLLIFEGEYGI